MTAEVLFAIEIIGTIAFACSGAMVAIERNLDLLGIVVLGVVTACGGGAFRDLMIGVIPPMMFQKPVYSTVAFVTCLIVFFGVRYPKLFFLQKGFFQNHGRAMYQKWMNLLDAVGLGAFTVVGCNAAIPNGLFDNKFLTIFLGVLTGVGGGLIRDILSDRTPVILCKHIYACASLAGALFYVGFYKIIPNSVNMIVSMAIVVLIRVLASKYCWDLPKAKEAFDTEE